MGAGRAVEAPFPRLAAGLLPVPHHAGGTLERRELGRGVQALVSTTLERAGFLAAFTERTGGVSVAPFDTLNLGILTADRRDAVLENRRRVVGALDVPPWAMGWQKHGAELARVTTETAGAGFDDGAPIEGVDALAVEEARVPVAVLVADCLPIALAARAGGLLVAVHAGWRGLAAGVLQRALALFAEPPLATIGPAIGPCHYEVGEEVVTAVDEASPGGAVVDRRDGRSYLDLASTAEGALRAAGVAEVERAGLCTACEPERFFSHRRDGETGRQALVAMRL